MTKHIQHHLADEAGDSQGAAGAASAAAAPKTTPMIARKPNVVSTP